MRNLIFFLLVLLFLCTTATYAWKYNPENRPVLVSLAKVNSASYSDDYQKLSRIFNPDSLVKGMNSQNTDLQKYERTIPLLEKIKEKTGSSRVAFLVDQEIDKIENLVTQSH